MSELLVLSKSTSHSLLKELFGPLGAAILLSWLKFEANSASHRGDGIFYEENIYFGGQSCDRMTQEDWSKILI